MKNSKLTEKQIKNLLKVQEESEQIKEVEKEIRDLEAEIDWAESQASNDYKYITHLEHRLDELYDKYNQMDNYESF